MGTDKNEQARKTQAVQKKNGFKATQLSNFVFTSFYPTKAEKQAIRSLSLSLETIVGAYLKLIDRDLTCTLKADSDKECLMLMLKENVPYGDPCRAVSFWHTDVTVLLAQLVWFLEHHLAGWLDSETALRVSEETDW